MRRAVRYAALIDHGDKLRCGVASVAISNFVTFLEGTAAYRRDARRLKYDARRASARARRRNALALALPRRARANGTKPQPEAFVRTGAQTAALVV